MGTKSDVEIAKLLREQEEKAVGETEGAKPEGWRWSRTGWGTWRDPECVEAADAAGAVDDAKDD